MSAMSGPRVLLANEPLCYRETILGVICAVRPLALVRSVGPEELEREVLRFAPELVVCSRVVPVVEARVPGWVELYPDHGQISTVCVGGACRTVDNMQLADLLSVVDEVSSSPAQSDVR